jgi:hypothetical protein
LNRFIHESRSACAVADEGSAELCGANG